MAANLPTGGDELAPSALSALDGTSANGRWSLYVFDDGRRAPRAHQRCACRQKR
jgi:hypothetical protein